MHAHIDGELDLVKTLDFERHILDCRNCSRARDGLLAMRASIRDGGLYFNAPLELAHKIRADARKSRTEPNRPTLSIGGRWMGIAASLALVAFALWALMRGANGSQENRLAIEIRSSHVRSLMGNHLLDVQSSDQHTVKPWFDGKLDFAPLVRDFKAESFPLAGGRLDYLGGRPVAALVYQHEKHFINLFTWPAQNETDQPHGSMARQGYVLMHWTHAGMHYWAISDTSAETLNRFFNLFVNEAAPATRP